MTTTVGGVKLIRVFLPDGSDKKFRIDDETSTESLSTQVAEKIDLPEAVRQYFAVYIVGPVTGLEIQVPPNVHPADIIDDWPHWEMEYKGGSGGQEPRVEFKRKQVVPIATELTITDPRAIDLLYSQAVHDVIKSVYVFSKDTTLQLVGLQLHISYGDHQKDRHQPGFFAGGNVDSVAPVHMRGDKKFKADGWEKAIFKAHSNHKGMDKIAAMQQYLEIVRTNCPYYGAVLYDATPVPTSKANKAAKLVDPLLLAISAQSISFVDRETKAVLLSVDRADPSTRHWSGATAEAGMVFTVTHTDKKKKETTYEFATRENDLIVNVLNNAPTAMLMNVSAFIDELLHMMPTESYNSGEYIVRWGDVGRCMYFISSGTVEIELPITDNQPRNGVKLSEGSYFGEIALFLKGTRTASVIAQTPVELLVLRKEVCDEVLHRYPHMEKAFRELGQQRLQKHQTIQSDLEKSNSKVAPAPAPTWMQRLSGKASRVKTRTSKHVATIETQRQVCPNQPVVFEPLTAPWQPEYPLLDPQNKFFLDVPTRLSAPRMDPFSMIVENPDREVDWYHRIFMTRQHDVFVGTHESWDGAVVVTILTSHDERENRFLYFTLVWKPAHVRHSIVESETELGLADILHQVDPTLHKNVKAFRSIYTPEIERILAKVENDNAELHRFKLGVLFAREGQTDENDMFSNEEGSANFNEFLGLLGEKVRLKGFTGYPAQLDTQNDQSGLYSVTRKFCGYDVMFHVSTLLRYDPADPQRIQRKRFIGNDIVVIVFMDGNTTYSVETMKSQYTNILLVVQPDPNDPKGYIFSSGATKGLRRFGPEMATKFQRNEAFVEYLLTKCINGEKTTYKSPEFQIREKRTRGTYLNDLVSENYDKGKKTTSLSAQKYNLNEIPDAPLQILDRRPVLTNFRSMVRCVHSVADVVFIGTDDGLWVVSDPSLLGGVQEEPHKIAALDQIVQILSDPGVGSLFVLTGGPTSRLFAFSLAELLNGSTPVVAMVPHTKNGSLFALGRVVFSERSLAVTPVAVPSSSSGRNLAEPGTPTTPTAPSSVPPLLQTRGGSNTNLLSMTTPGTPHAARTEKAPVFYMCVVEEQNLMVFTVRTDGSYRLTETIPLPGTPACLTMTATGVLVGIKAEDNTPAHFLFFDLGLDVVLHTFTPIYTAQPGDVPLAAFVLDHGLLLCFDRMGVVLNSRLKPDTSVSWEWLSPPVSFAHSGPLLAVYTRTFVEIRSTINGSLVETHRVATKGHFACSGDNLYASTRGAAEGSTDLYWLAPLRGKLVTDDDDQLVSVLNEALQEENHDGSSLQQNTSQATTNMNTSMNASGVNASQVTQVQSPAKGLDDSDEFPTMSDPPAGSTTTPSAAAPLSPSGASYAGATALSPIRGGGAGAADLDSSQNASGMVRMATTKLLSSLRKERQGAAGSVDVNALRELWEQRFRDA